MKLFLLSKAVFLLTFLTLASQDSLRIVFSKATGSENYRKYISFIQSVYPSVYGINAFGMEIGRLDSLLGEFDGLVLTGGPDVHPRYYGREEDTAFCEYDLYRDSLEFYLIDIAFRRKIPIFAICRGEQILNVYLGGSLHPDLPTFASGNIRHRCNENEGQCLHLVFLDTNSNFYKLIGLDSFFVNSFHHQGVARLGKNLRPVAFSSDNLVEAYEWDKANQEPFIIAVQWHPERLGIKDTVSNILATRFIEEVLRIKSKVKNQK